MTTYSSPDLNENWEFKIVRSATRAFRNPDLFAALLEEESVAGRELAEKLDNLRVNFSTIARAYRLLDEAGIISTQHGRGTYILEQPDAKASQKLRKQSLITLADQFLSQAKTPGYSPG